MTKRAFILGMGLSGRAAKELLEVNGYEVVGADVVPGEPLPDISGFDLHVVSPGVDPRHPLVDERFIGEAELALRECKHRAIAITGTNGKTTTTLMVAHVLEARALGNVGDPLSSYFVNPNPDEILVVELSSYQLERLEAKVFDVGVILNITPDHLDRYANFKAYAAAKHRLRALSKVCFENLSCVEATKKICGEFGLSEAQVEERLKSFKGPPHRLEFVKEIGGVRYINDSKGTNVASVEHALESIDGPVILIAGGVDKGGSYAPLKGRAMRVLSIGEAAKKIQVELGGEIVETLERALQRAQMIAKRGDTVLLSPACASFDQFADYRDRGERFKQLVGCNFEDNL